MPCVCVCVCVNSSLLSSTQCLHDAFAEFCIGAFIIQCCSPSLLFVFQILFEVHCLRIFAKREELEQWEVRIAFHHQNVCLHVLLMLRSCLSLHVSSHLAVLRLIAFSCFVPQRITLCGSSHFLVLCCIAFFEWDPVLSYSFLWQDDRDLDGSDGFWFVPIKCNSCFCRFGCQDEAWFWSRVFE